MRIVIAGAGEVGIHLAKMLSREELDVILVDSNEDVLSEIENNYNLSAIAGSPTSFNSLKRAGINTVDDLINKSPDEMMRVRNLGKKSLEEVIVKLQSYGLTFMDEKELN